MSLHVLNGAERQATLCEENCYIFEWRPEKNYISGTEFEIRLDPLRPFVHWRFVRWHVNTADVKYRWQTDYSVSEMRKNPQRVLMRARAQYELKRGEPVRIEAWAVPAHWAGIDAALSVWITTPVRRGGRFVYDEEPVREPDSVCGLVVTPAGSAGLRPGRNSQLTSSSRRRTCSPSSRSSLRSASCGGIPTPRWISTRTFP